MGTDWAEEMARAFEMDPEDYGLGTRTEERLAALLRRVRAEALEEAAKECDDEALRQPKTASAQSGACRCAYRVRKLAAAGGGKGE